MTLMEYVIALMETCPHITVENPNTAPVVRADGVGKDADSYSVESLPGEPVIRLYLGGARKQYLFTLSSRKDTFTNAEKLSNAAMYERISGWLEELTRFRRLPPMGEGRQPQRLEAVDSGYPLEMAEDNNTGLYVMQCRLIYHEKARTNQCV